MVNQTKRKVILDTDPGIDDLQAMIMLLADPNVEVLAFTTVAGNACFEQVMVNAQKFLHHTGNTHIPLYQGSKCNLSGISPASDGFFGVDAFANNPHSVPEDFPKQEMTSVEALLHYTKKYPGEIELIAIGPMTNLALAYLMDNKFPDRLKSLYLMVADDTEETKFNVSPYAEFNCWCDPVAFKLVCKTFFTDGSKKIKLVDFNLCQRHLLSFDNFDKFYGQGVHKDKYERNVLGRFIEYAYDFTKTKWYSDGAVTCDPFATFLCLHPESKYESKIVSLKSVCLEGEKVAHTVFEEDPKGNIELITSVDFEHFFQVFHDAVTKKL